MKQPTILIAEQDETLRENLRGQLFVCGFDVIESPDRSGILDHFRRRC
jgi:hypothetical protein